MHRFSSSQSSVEGPPTAMMRQCEVRVGQGGLCLRAGCGSRPVAGGIILWSASHLNEFVRTRLRDVLSALMRLQRHVVDGDLILGTHRLGETRRASACEPRHIADADMTEGLLSPPRRGHTPRTRAPGPESDSSAARIRQSGLASPSGCTGATHPGHRL